MMLSMVNAIDAMREMMSNNIINVQQKIDALGSDFAAHMQKTSENIIITSNNAMHEVPR
jgi:hypothetical protein